LAGGPPSGCATAVRDVFPQLEEVEIRPQRRFRIPAGLDGLFQAPTADELAAMRSAADLFAAQGAQGRAGALQSLEQKVLSATRAAARRRLAPDLEALLQAETIAVQAGPRPFEDAAVLSTVREAVKGLGGLSFRYEGGRPRAAAEGDPAGGAVRAVELPGGGGEPGGVARTGAWTAIFDIALADFAGAAACGLLAAGLCLPELRHLPR